ncbi:hypothetical protein FNQ90_16040 [Streptomyces alkaliphilus]|uniref:Uncharacterized protein n=2 Tax=Streptomyces alkaliphilus TaxID=1472722 RepID=A0A7W3TEZ4_9ACTN|nr:hypothetical protein [Streptomyces alkaliphilus]
MESFVLDLTSPALGTGVVVVLVLLLLTGGRGRPSTGTPGRPPHDADRTCCTRGMRRPGGVVAVLGPIAAGLGALAHLGLLPFGAG